MYLSQWMYLSRDYRQHIQSNVECEVLGRNHQQPQVAPFLQVVQFSYHEHEEHVIHV